MKIRPDEIRPMSALKAAPTVYDETPVHDGPPNRNRGYREAARRYGLALCSVAQFYQRHPECAGWDVDRVCRQVIANRDQRAVAKRQYREGHHGPGGFGPMKYED